MIWHKRTLWNSALPRIEYSCKQKVKGILGWWWVGTEEMANIYPSSSLYCALLSSRKNFILPSPEGLLNTNASRKVMWSLSHLTVILVNTGSSIGRESLGSTDEFINTSVQLCQVCLFCINRCTVAFGWNASSSGDIEASERARSRTVGKSPVCGRSDLLWI